MKKGFLWIAFAFIFLFNPNITVFDVLPDFIGYVLLIVGMSKIADLNDTLGEARKLFERMILIDLCKILAIFWIFGMQAVGERTSSMLLWSFVFGVLEMLCLIPAYQKLFDGMISLGNFHENTAVFFEGRQKGGKSITEKLKGFSVFFVILKAVLCFLPEMADLTNTSYNEGSGVVDLYRYIGIMRFMAFLPVLVVGIVWLVRMLRYWKRIGRDESFCTSLEQTYKEKVLPRTGLFICRSVRIAFSAWIVAAILTLDVRLENFNFLPDILAAVAFFIFFLRLKKHTPGKKAFSFVSMTAYAVTCVASFVMQTYFFTTYSYSSILRNDRALLLYGIAVGIECLKAAAFLVTVCAALLEMRRVIVSHTGYVLGQTHVAPETAQRQIAAEHKELKRYLLYVIVAAVLYAVSDVSFEIFVLKVGFMGVLNMICGLIFVATAIKAQSEILESVKTKYMFD